MRAWRCRLAADVRGGMDATLFNQNKIKKTELKERDCKFRTYQYIAEPRVRAI